MTNEEISNYDSVREFYNGIGKDANELDNCNVDYCIIVYEIKDSPNPYSNSKSVKWIYKTLQDFLDKFPEAYPQIPPSSGIYVQLWQFD